MVDIQSKEVIDKISDELKIQPSMMIPRGVSKQIDLSYNVNPRRDTDVLGRIADRTTTASNVTIFTADEFKDTFLTDATLACSFDATNNTQLVSIGATIKGLTTRIFEMKKNSTTATLLNDTIHFHPPMLVDANTTVTLSSTFSAGASSVSVKILGYTTDPQ